MALPWVALDDLAAVVAELIDAPAPPAIRVVAGPQALTGDEVAAELALALGHDVRWRCITPAEYERMLAPYLGAEAAANVAAAYAAPPAPAPDPAVVHSGSITVRSWAAAQRW